MNNKKSIIKNNIVSGLIRVGISVVMPFVIRTVMLYCLGAEYQGLNNLFASILSVLNLAELGFSSAIVYSMYKPIAQGDKDKVCALLAYYRKVYRTIGVIVLSAGFVVMPFITFLVKGSWPADINVYVLFMIYLGNTSISYFFFAYKTALLNAQMRIDVVNIVQSVTLLIQYVIQTVVLVVIRNYYVYIIFMPLFTIIFNIITARRANQLFPEYQCRGMISKEERKAIGEKIKGLMIYRLSEISRNSVNTIILTSLFGLVVQAIYNNYFYIVSAVYTVMIAVNQGIQALIGNSIAAHSVEKNHEDFKTYNFWLMWLISWCTVCLVCLYQHFMEIWVGKELLLSNTEAIAFGLYFYVLNMNNVKNLYFDGRGLWLEGKWTFILEAVFNVVLNFVFAKLFGISGVLIGTILTLFVFSFVCRSKILYRHYFGSSPKSYFWDNVELFVVMAVACLATYTVCGLLPGNSILYLAVKIIVCAILPNLVMLVLYWKKPQVVGIRGALLKRLGKSGL